MFIVGVEERTLLAVVFGERPLAELPDMLSTCMAVQLALFAVPRDRILAERAAVRSATFGKNRSRSHLGILNEVAYQFEVWAGDSAIASADELLEIQTRLNAIPHRASSPRAVCADEEVVALLGTPTVH